MANFLAVIDRDAARRERCLAYARTQLAPVEGLTTASAGCEDLGVVWAARSTAPVSSTAGDRALAVIWGRAHSPTVPGPVAASVAAGRWSDADVQPEPLDGFFGVISYACDGGLAVEADLLGLFPIYYAADDEVVLVSSTPTAIGWHPRFAIALDPVGLASALLFHAPIAGRTVVAGVRRLAAGHALRWSRRDGLREVEQYRIPHPSGLDDLSFSDQIDRLHVVMDGATGRQAPPGPERGLMLSGGRDSRMLGGYLRRHGVEVHALTMGWKTDDDVRCGRAAARRLGFRHEIGSIEYDEFPDAARRQIEWEHLVTGFSTVHAWKTLPWLDRLPPTFVAGYVVGPTVGGKGLISSAAPHGRVISFDKFYSLLERQVVPPARLRGILRPALHDAIDTVMRDARSIYEGYRTPESQRPWRFLLAHSERFHAGGVPWRLTFGSWPIIPILDRRVLDLLGSLPADILANRRAQDAILTRCFPDLARIVLDRNARHTDPLAPTPWYRVRKRIHRRLRRHGLLPSSPRAGVEPRYYYRMYDFNGPGWRTIREMAEPHRERLAPWFDLDALGEFLPGPHTDVDLPDAIQDAYARKLLIGLMLWTGHHCS